MKKTLFTLSILLLFSQLFIAQNLKRANHLFEKRAYLDAAELFLNEETKTQEVYEKLGDCYYFNSKMKDASNWYKILFQKFEDTIDANYYFKYAQSLKGINDFKEADKWLRIYYDKKQITTERNLETLSFIDSLNNLINRPYIVHHLINANTKISDFGTAFFGDKIVFASTRNNRNIYDWNKQPYLDLYEAELTENGDFSNISSFSNAINTKTHESNAVFTKDGKTMYFTRNNFIEGKKLRDKIKITHLKIYKAQLIDGAWTNITELPFNSNNYSVEHPALSTDEKQLFFSSDMPGSIGSFDLFVVDIEEDGTYGIPKNLGPTINTINREQFPFISSKNILYFASDGHFGLGGLDIFKSEFLNGKFSTPLNLSDKINSNLDDFSFIIDEENETGYFSSNREGGIGDDDIYRFTQKNIIYLIGQVQDKNTSEILPNSTVVLFDENNNKISDILVDENASFNYKIDQNKNYKISANNNLFHPYLADFSTDSNKNVKLLLELSKINNEELIVENGKTQIKINPIYFDLNSSIIRLDATKELDKVVEIMNKYPELIVECGSHTDSRDSYNYNIWLSNRRSVNTVKYILSKGISPERISGKGYGESQIINHCSNDVICSEKDHELNRRTEFIIINPEVIN